MKKMIKCMALALVGITVAANVAACGGGGGNPFIDTGSIVEKDETKAQLYVGCYEGGVGRAWLDSAIKRFEAQYADEEFEPGKKGVQVYVDYSKSYASTSLMANMVSAPQSVIFTEQMYFNDYVTQGRFLDISDIVTGSLSSVTGGKESASIESKLTETQQAAYTAQDGNYYCLPHYEVFGGLSYDADLFEEYNLYVADTEIADVNSDNYGCVADKYTNRSKGPDGKTGVINGVDYSVDDGLPATYEEFFKVCDKMVSNGIQPFLWTGGFPEYINLLAIALYANEEGAENYSATLTFDSNGKEIPVYNDNMVIENKVITNENAYLLRRQPGKYNSIQFMRKMLDNPNYISSYCTSSAVKHLDAQAFFIGEEKGRFGFLVEGNYWYNEAEPRFKELVAEKGEGQGWSSDERNFKWMPLPRATKVAADDYKMTTVDRNYTCAFVNSNIANNANKVRLAKMFLQFCYTKESLIEFTEETGTTKGVMYNLTAEEENTMLSKLNTFKKSVWDFRKKADIVYPVSDSEILINNQQAFSIIESDWSVSYGGTEYQNALAAFKNNVTAEQYFKAGWMNESVWLDQYSVYFK